MTRSPAEKDSDAIHNELLTAICPTLSRIPASVVLSKVFGGTEEGWLVQQVQYGLAQVRRDRIKLKRLEVA
jgi:plasmid maintenance system antidote protein VapI